MVEKERAPEDEPPKPLGKEKNGNQDVRKIYMVAPEDTNKNENIEKIIREAKEELIKNGTVKLRVVFERRGRLIPPAPMEALDELDERLGISRNEHDRKSRDIYGWSFGAAFTCR